MTASHNPDPGTARRSARVVLLIMAIFLLLAVLSSPGITVTLDEPLHYHYGRFVLQGNTDRIDDSSMPVSALNALPGHIAAFLDDGILKTVLERYFMARLVTIIFAMFIAIVVFRWTESLYGFVPALFAGALYVLDPTLIAHSQLVTTDVFATGMVALSMYALWKFASSRTALDGLICAVVIGVSQLVKYTAVALYPIGFAALFLHDWSLLRGDVGARRTRALLRLVGRLGFYLIVALSISMMIINLGFLFNRTFTPLHEYSFRSELFQRLQANVPLLDQLPVPLPYPYLEGLDWMRYTERNADRYGNVYLLGELRKPGGFAGYYFVASALKVPIATQIIILLALGVYVLDRERRRRFLKDEVFLLLPVAVLTIYFNFFFNAQTGLRYYLVVFPLLYVFSGSLFRNWTGLSARSKAASIALVVYLAASVLSYFPYFTPYFNELVWDKARTYKYLADTNLEWGQSRGDLWRYLAAHPKAVYNPAQVQAGHLVVGGSDLVGILEDPVRYEWLRDNFEPVDTIAFCYFVYRISPEEITELCSRTEYCR